MHRHVSVTSFCLVHHGLISTLTGEDEVSGVGRLSDPLPEPETESPTDNLMSNLDMGIKSTLTGEDEVSGVGRLSDSLPEPETESPTDNLMSDVDMGNNSRSFEKQKSIGNCFNYTCVENFKV